MFAMFRELGLPNDKSLIALTEGTLLILAIATLLLSPLMQYLGIAMSDTSIALIDIFFVLHCILMREFNWLKTSWVKVVLLLWAFMIFRGFFAIDQMRAVTHALSFICFAFFAAGLQFWLLRSVSLQKLLVWSILTAVSFVALNGFLQFFHGSDLLGHHPFYSIRLRSLTGKLNPGAISMMIFMPVIAFLFQKSATSLKWIEKIVPFLLAIFLLVFIPMTGERNATLMTIFGCGLLFILAKSCRWPLIIALIFCSLSILGIFTVNKTIAKRETTTTTHVIKSLYSKRESTNYSGMFATDWHEFKLHWVWGDGMRGFTQTCLADAKSGALNLAPYHGWCNTNPQNIWFDFLDSTGVIGTALFLWLLVIFFKRYYQHWTLIHSNIILLGVFIAICMRLFPLQSTTSFFFSWGGFAFWLMTGWLMAAIDNAKPKL